MPNTHTSPVTWFTSVARFAYTWLSLAAPVIFLSACQSDATKEAPTPDIPEVVSFDVPGSADGGATLPADFGTACEDNSECLSGFCVFAPDGFVCSTHCIESCPSGWQCRGIASGSSDLAFVCVPAEMTDADVSDGPPDSDVMADALVGSDAHHDAIGPSPDPDLCGIPLGGAGEIILAEGPGGDFGDCVVGCGRPASDLSVSLDLRTQGYTAIQGRIDHGEHRYGGQLGPDTDVVSVVAPPRTFLEFAIQRSTAMSRIDPIVYITDGFAIRAFNRNSLNHNDCASTTIAFPWLRDLPIYVVVEDSVNSDAWAAASQAPASWVGGDDYGWLMRVRAKPFAPIELGRLTAAINLGGQTFAQTGLTRYYRFTASGLADFTVRIAEDGQTHPDFVLFAGGMKTMLGALEWHRMADDGGGQGSVTLDRAAFRPCAPPPECSQGNCNGPVCTADDVEYIFAVGDWEGGGGLGFNYSVAITPR